MPPPSALQRALVRRLRPIVVDGAARAAALSCQHTSSRIPLTLMQQPSLDAFAANEAPGAMALVREGSADGRVMGLGFYDPSSVAVEMFEWTCLDTGDAAGSTLEDQINAHQRGAEADGADEIAAAISGGLATSSPIASPSSLALPPVPDVRYFHGKLMAAFRRRSLPHHKGRGGRIAAVVPSTNARRLFNGAADGIPSLYIDQYGATAHVYVASAAAAQLLPLVEVLLLRVLEMRRVYHFTTESIQFGVRETVAAAAPTLETSFYEDGMVLYAPSEQLNPNIRTITDVLRSTFSYAFHPLQHAASRRWLARHCANRSVALLGDEVSSIGAALSAVTAASKVYYSYERDRSLKRLRSQFAANFNDTIFNARVEPMRSGELSFPAARQMRPDIVVHSGVALSGRFASDAAFALDFLLEGREYANNNSTSAAESDGSSAGGTERVGYLVLLCGSNALGLPRLSSAGLVPSAESMVGDTIAFLRRRYAAGGECHGSVPMGRSVVITEVSRTCASEGFRHGRSVEAGGLTEGWGAAFCDVVLEVRMA